MAALVPPVRGSAFTLTFPVFDTSGKLKTGATFSATQISKDGAAFGAATNTPAELATSSGVYTLALTASEMTADTVAVRMVISTSSTQDVEILIYTAAQTFDGMAAAVWTATSRTLTSNAGVSYAGPVSVSGTVALVIGDDYKNADSRQLSWSTTASSTWPDLTGATVKFNSSANGINAITMTITTPTGATKLVYAEITKAQSATPKAGTYTFNVQATLSNGDVVTLVQGSMTIAAAL